MMRLISITRDEDESREPMVNQNGDHSLKRHLPQRWNIPGVEEAANFKLKAGERSCLITSQNAPGPKLNPDSMTEPPCFA